MFTCIEKIRTKVCSTSYVFIDLNCSENSFLDPIAQDVISVKSFDGRWEVNTFRTIGKYSITHTLKISVCF